MANQPKKYKKFVATAATATLVASAIVPVASAAGFKDVANNTHADAINALAAQGVINGYPDGTFKPNKDLTRSDVVKLLGKYLVSKGYSVPADAKTVQRFNDVPVDYKDQELVEYAALVKDAGVFKGSNNNLNAANKITRGQMALVVVRALDTLNDTDLVKFVEAQDFDKEVIDLNTASKEQQEAINVLDFFDITKTSKFNPNSTTTRGQFASFLYRAINTDFSDVTDVAVVSLKAINATTVEVTFADEVEDVKALNFAIEGLEVKNAAVKQTDAKTVVLTTSTQEGGKVYTVTNDGAKLGTFTGVSAVIPTAIKVNNRSVQGTIGKEVTVTAEVTVPDGQSKAGIPVTFNIVNDSSNLNGKIEVVAYTDEQGVASYSYTRYYEHNDNVTAYATDKSSVYATGKVYWADSLTITEVTEGNELANGAKKVYKVKVSKNSWKTENKGTADTNDDYNYVNVAFVENTDVSPDKLVRDVEVIDTGIANHGTYTQSKYPSQVTTGGVQTVRVKVNADGEATFTLTGSNSSVTPVVFVDADNDGKYDADELQAKAPTVKFALSHTLGLTVKAEGSQNAAGINAKGTGEGGRKYTVTVTDKDGKVAPEGTIVYVTFADGATSKDRVENIYALNADGNKDTTIGNGSFTDVKKDSTIAVKVYGSKGEAQFLVTGDRDGFVTPTVYIDNGTDNGKLDKNDLQTVAETTYFVDAVINNATLKVKNAAGKEVETLPSNQVAYFHYNSVDQNGLDYYAGTGDYEVSFEVTAHFADVVAGGRTVKKGTTETIKLNAVAGKAVLAVSSENVASNVTVNASASQVSLPNKSASIAFTKGTQVPNVYTGLVASINTTDNKLTFAGYDAITYSTSSFKNEQGIVIDEEKFEKLVSDALAANQPVTVTSKKIQMVLIL